MAINTLPVFPKSGDIQWGANAITAANTAKDGTGTVNTIYTAPADGGFVQSIRFRAAGTNVATVARIFINNGGANSTAANNILFNEITLPATTLSEVAAQSAYELPLNVMMPEGYKINVVLGTAVAAGYFASVVAGKYTA